MANYLAVYNSTGQIVEQMNLPSPVLITKASDFRVYPMVTSYIAYARNAIPVLVEVQGQIWSGPSPPLVQILFWRVNNTNQYIKYA